MCSDELALKKNARKVPVRTSTTNAYSAISPSRNAQWSGKILLSDSSTKRDVPRRSSNHRARRLSTGRASAPLRRVFAPEARTDRLVEVAPRDEVTVAVDSQRQ